jgi:hypothetical protein
VTANPIRWGRGTSACSRLSAIRLDPLLEGASNVVTNMAQLPDLSNGTKASGRSSGMM